MLRAGGFIFSLEFSRTDRNVTINVVTNVAITDMEKKVLDLLNKDRSMSAIGISVIIGKSLELFKGCLNRCEGKD